MATGIGEDGLVSFGAIGKELGISDEQARRIFNTGMAKLRDYLRDPENYGNAHELWKLIFERAEPKNYCARRGLFREDGDPSTDFFLAHDDFEEPGAAEAEAGDAKALPGL